MTFFDVTHSSATNASTTLYYLVDVGEVLAGRPQWVQASRAASLVTPLVLSHTYSTPGRHTVKLMVSDAPFAARGDVLLPAGITLDRKPVASLSAAIDVSSSAGNYYSRVHH